MQLATLLMVLCLVGGVRAQTFDFAHDRQPVASYAGPWKFMPGDNLDWARPALDDSAWKTISSEKGWRRQGFPNLTGYAWYRFRLIVPAGQESFSLQLPELYVSYACFIDGKLAHVAGALAPATGGYYQTTVVLPLALSGRPAPETHTIALRVWRPASVAAAFNGGPGFGAARDEVFGPTPEIEEIRNRNVEAEQLQNSAALDLGVLSVVAGLTSLLLFLLRRREREYLWFGIAVMAPGIPLLVQYWQVGKVINVIGYDVMLQAKVIVSVLAYLLFYKTLLRARARWGFWLAVVAILLNPVPLVLLEFFNAITVGTANAINLALQLPYQGWIVWLLVRRTRQGVADAGLLLAPVASLYVWVDLNDALETAKQLGWTGEYSLRSWHADYPFPITPRDIANGLFLLVMFVILLNRFARTRREQEQYETQFQAAREVQRFLVPETLQIPTGFQVAAEYRPAQEVGGDFYQVVPVESGGLLVVVGDVAGKGMPAAMMVAMIVGVIRTQAQLSSSPVQMLQVLNERMQGRTGGGFSTCIAARIGAEGEMLVANAGHLPPYRNGAELAVTGSLPLGLVPDVEQSEQTFHLAPGDRLMFISDGIVEAQNRAKQLFGFERTLAMSLQPAEILVKAAQDFGQNDDLTVITLTFTGPATGNTSATRSAFSPVNPLGTPGV